MGLLTMTASAGSGVDRMYKRGKNGTVSLVDVDRSAHIIPAVGGKGRFELTGISEPFDLPNKFGDNPDEMKKMVRLEFRVIKGSDNGTKMQEGKFFTCLYGYSVGPKSNLGKLLSAIRGDEIKPGESISLDDFIGTSFVTKTLGQVQDKTKFSRLSDEAIDADSVKWPEAAASGEDGEDGDPFEDDEDL